MGIENIKAKILAEAEGFAQGVIKEAQGQVDEILGVARGKADKIIESTKDQATEEAALIKSRKMSVASLEVRKIRLQAKQEQINKSFQIALDRLSEMEEDDYLKLLMDTIIRIGGDGGEIILNERDKNKLGNKLVEMVNGTGKVGKMSLADDTIDAKGGFVLRRGSTEVNSSLETMISEIKEETIPQVVEVLYGS